MKLNFTIDRLKRMAIFARVIELGSMSAAGRELGMSASAVSQQIRKLEAEAGISLLHRSTRKLSVTEAGRGYYEDCAGILVAAQAAERRLDELREAPRGELRIAFPVSFGPFIAAALAPKLLKHTGLSLRLFAEDRLIDMITERIDLAVRVGPLGDSSLVARRIGEWQHLLLASPNYVAWHGLPQTPEELSQHSVLLLTVLSKAEFIEMHRFGEPLKRVRVSGPVVGNSFDAVKEMMLQGLGIFRVPGPEASALISAGKAIQVLPGWEMSPLLVHAVTVQRQVQPAKVRWAIEALREVLRS
jgi:DNA-binding transcriptional LysR family regulator